MDGFETAELIRGRERSGTCRSSSSRAVTKDDDRSSAATRLGAVDYIFKPFNPRSSARRSACSSSCGEKKPAIRATCCTSRSCRSSRRASAERYRQLADAMPQIVWTADVDGNATYYNRRWFEYTGMTRGGSTTDSWARVDLTATTSQASARQTLADGASSSVEYPLPRRRRHATAGTSAAAVPIREDGAIDFWIGTATDIDDRKRTEEAQRFLLDAAPSSRARSTSAPRSHASPSSLCRGSPTGARSTLVEDGRNGPRSRVEHCRPRKVVVRPRAPGALPARRPTTGVGGRGIAPASAQLVAEIPEERSRRRPSTRLHARLLRQLGSARTCASRCSPATARSARSRFVSAESGRRYGESDLRLAEELAARAAAAIENAQLYGRPSAAAGGARARDDRRRRRAPRQRRRVRLWNTRGRGDHRHRASATSRPAGRGRVPGWHEVDRASVAGPASARGRRRSRSRSAAASCGCRSRACGFDGRHGLRLPRPDRGARARADALRLRRHGLARAAHAARRDLRRGGHAAARGRRARATRCGPAARRVAEESSASRRSSTTCCSRASSTRASCRSRSSRVDAARGDARRGRRRAAHLPDGVALVLDAPTSSRRSRPTSSSCGRCSSTCSRTRSSTRPTAAR